MLPYHINDKRTVEDLCAFGFPNSDILPFEPSGDANDFLQPLFVYVTLYRPQGDVYRMTSQPVVVYHRSARGCISSTHGYELNWLLQKGDKIGVFIPQSCTSVTNLTQSEVLNSIEVSRMLGEETLVCPSQVNLAVHNNSSSSGAQCTSAFYLNGSLMEVTEVRLEQFTLEQTILSVNVFTTTERKFQ